MVALLADPGLPQHLLLDGVSWNTYEMLLHDLEGRRFRITFDRGRLEIMALSYRHENRKSLLRRFVETVTFQLYIPIQPGGSMTFKNELLERGLEPDECYWIANEPSMRNKLDFDILRDPPPDLAIEIEVTRSALNRLDIYAALGVPEVWRFDGKKLRVCILGANGKYREKQTSKVFPFLPMKDFERFLLDTEAPNHTALMHAFHDWVKATLVPAYAEKKAKKNGAK
jgi:Uma2 family endonuclease